VNEEKRKSVIVDTIEENGRSVHIYDNGAKKDATTGYWIQPPPKAKITHELAREFAALRKAKGVQAQLAGLAKSMDLEPSDVPEELINQAGSALEAITHHMATTFKNSRNLRGMGEVYDKLAAPLVGDRREKQDDTPSEPTSIVVLLAQYISQVTDMSISASNKEDVIDGSIAEDKEHKDE
jgi:hypothetical protein